MAERTMALVVGLLLLGFTGTLLVSAQAWESVSGNPFANFFQTGDDGDYDTEDVVPEESLPEVEGVYSSEGLDSFADRGFEVEFTDSGPSNWAVVDNGELQVEFEEPPPRSLISSYSQSSTELDVVCTEAGFQITFLTGLMSDVKVVGVKDVLSVTEADKTCGYDVNPLTNTLTVAFSGCHVKNTDGYSLQLLYTDELGHIKVSTVSCDQQMAAPVLAPRANSKSKCTDPPTTPAKAKNCAVSTGEQLPCGQQGISAADCEKMGCCVDSSKNACYYPMDECTADHHFVFAIRSDSASIPLDPKKLVIPGTSCKPVIVNEKAAIYKFKITECGARAYEAGGMKIYLAEVQTIVKALNLKFGIISRSDALRFMIECRYGKQGETKQSVASVGYMVKVPSSAVPSQVVEDGLYGVQLRIAKDNTYTSYYPTTNQPLRVLLGKPVYLELRMKSPRPKGAILVNYCLAYPRSAKNALVLVYKGCANPNDPNVAILSRSDFPKNRYQRRFSVNAFQFMNQKTNKYLDEEIYFMCSSEVCIPPEKTCEERCFDGKAP